MNQNSSNIKSQFQKLFLGMLSICLSYYFLKLFLENRRSIVNNNRKVAHNLDKTYLQRIQEGFCHSFYLNVLLLNKRKNKCIYSYK